MRERGAVRSALLVGALFAAACAAPREEAAPAEALRRFALAPLRLPGAAEDVLLGWVDVPENRTLVGGRQLSLRVIVVPARKAKTGAAPLLFLDGGPGQAATQAAPWFLESVLREERDIVLVDVRGTGGSGGLQFLPVADPLLAALDEMYPPPSVEANREALSAVADLSCYTTVDVVEDLEAVRAWLGYAQWDLFGLSYGTRVALEYLRQHPGAVRSAVLEGVAPYSLTMPSQHAPAGQRALQALFDECAADPACAARFADLGGKLGTVLARLAESPASASYTTADGTTRTLPVRAEIFAESLRRMLYARASSQVVPLLVQRAWEGDFAPWLRLVELGARSEPGGVPLADGFYLCVTCAEDVPFLDAQAERLAQGTWCGDYRLRQQRRACALWPVEPVDASFREPVACDVPVLILSGAMDPVTPAEFGAEVARHLLRARQIVVPHMGHMEDGLSRLECFETLVREFFERGAAEGLDASCVQDMQPPPFVLDESGLPAG